MAAILNTAILNLAIFDSSILVCPLKLTHTCQDWFPPFAQKNFTHSFWLNLMMAAILNSANLHSATLVFFSQTHSHLPRLVPTLCTKKTLTHSFWLNLMMAAILNSAMLDSDTWWCHLGFNTFKNNLLSFNSLKNTHSDSHLQLWFTLTQTNSIWLT